jgi:hypothetical protein
MDSLLIYDKAEIGEISVSREGKPVFDLANFHIDIKRPQGDDPLEFDGAAESFAADLSDVGDPKSEAAIQALGYEHLQGSFAMAGSWKPGTGEGSLDSYRFTVKNAGTLDISVKTGGVTPEFVRSVQAIRNNIAEAPASRKRAPLTAMGMLFEQLTLNGAAITFRDDSLTGKILDYAAAEQGVDRATIVEQATAMLPLALAALGDPETAAESAGAISAFLGDPKSLVIRAEPPNPVPFKAIAGGSMLQLPRLLGVKIEANR